MAQKLSAKDLDFFKRANSTPYYTQAKLFLNAFWNDGMSGKAEEVWNLTQGYIRTDLHLKGCNPPNPAREGTQLDEHGFHYFLEKEIKPLTVLEARAKLKEADVSFDGKVSLLEFLNWHYKKRSDDFVRRAPEDVEGDKNMTPELQKATAALNAAKREIQKIEDEKNRLEDEAAGSGLKSVKAKNELAQLLSRDNTELNKALLTAEAAVRKAGGTGKECPPGTLWWMQREIEEMKKYKPRSKQ
eukprot:TRINITY_DN619_c0_g2_i1.p1 TRINITY_DN619_c0_g2~~TRINITY_DN619_c0_g2_i1.p1  ORF type:complete len:271 (-),score=114.81 TRINITY_DN619_c0_g2_i1:165-893(-)